MACPIRKGVIVLEFLLLSACASVRPAPSSPVSSELSDLSTLSLSSLDNDSNPGCLSMVNQFCTSLYEPGKDGNLVIQTKKGKAISILQGKTENDLNQVFFELSKSKIKHQKELPSDFLSILRAHSYFKKLDDLLRRKPRATMNLTDRVESLEQEAELDSLWNISIQDTLLIRTTDKFPNFPEMKDELIPPEIVHFQRQEKKVILSEISRAIWKNHRNWARVNSTFEDLRKAYLKVIDRLHVLPRIKSDWADRIKSLRLVPPGSLPAIADQECASTTMNAYYYPQLNVLTICAGDFNSEESLSTLAHEMSHALDLNRSLFIYFKESEFSQILHEVNRGFCGTNAIHYSCDKWEQFKKGLDPHMVELSHFTADVPEFNRCLKREHTKPLDQEAVNRFADHSVQSSIQDLVEEEAFLRVTRKELPLGNQKKAKNPSYFNPCFYLHTDWDSESLDSELSILTAFLEEYQCSKESNPLRKLKTSLTTTQNMFTDVMRAMISSEGEFSGRRILVDESFSSSPVERFADLMGSYVVAEYMRGLQSLWDKRVVFLAGNSWQCNGPSLAQSYPAESLMLWQYLRDSHTDGEDRKKEILSTPIRAELGCKLDFSWNECHLP